MIVPFDDLELVHQSLRTLERPHTHKFPRVNAQDCKLGPIQPWDVKDFFCRPAEGESSSLTTGSCSHTPASSALRASCRSARIRATARALAGLDQEQEPERASGERRKAEKGWVTDPRPSDPAPKPEPHVAVEIFDNPARLDGLAPEHVGDLGGLERASCVVAHVSLCDDVHKQCEK